MNIDLGASASTARHEFCAVASGPTAALPVERLGVNRHA